MSTIDLVKLNVWLDVIFSTLWFVVVAVLAFHFVLGWVTGRAQKKWLKHQWPEHDWAPPPAPKIMHAQHMTMMLILGFTGMYIRFPFFTGGRVAMRYIHYFAMTVVTINLIWRFWYAFYSKQRDWREFAIGRKDAESFLGVAMYYAYLSNKKPHVAKYNVMQKGSYIFFALLMILQAFTGFALLTFNIPILHVTPRFLLVGWWLGAFLGSVDLAGWYARTAHYIINWLFIVLTTVHVYLSASEDVPCTLDFFGLKKLPVNPDAFGHGHHAPEPETNVAPVLTEAE